MKKGQINWRLAWGGCVLLAAGVLLYLVIPLLAKGLHTPLPWALYATILTCILGGLASIAHSLTLHELGHRYVIVCFASVCGGTAYLWLNDQVRQCTRFASLFGITHPKLVCGTAFCVGTIWVIYVGLLFVSGFIRGLSPNAPIKSGSNPPQQTPSCK